MFCFPAASQQHILPARMHTCLSSVLFWRRQSGTSCHGAEPDSWLHHAHSEQRTFLSWFLLLSWDVGDSFCLMCWDEVTVFSLEGGTTVTTKHLFHSLFCTIDVPMYTAGESVFYRRSEGSLVPATVLGPGAQSETVQIEYKRNERLVRHPAALIANLSRPIIPCTLEGTLQPSQLRFTPLVFICQRG